MKSAHAHHNKSIQTEKPLMAREPGKSRHGPCTISPARSDPGARLTQRLQPWVAGLMLGILPLAQSSALEVTFTDASGNMETVVDNQQGDQNPAPGIIDFRLSIFGLDFTAFGRLEEVVAGATRELRITEIPGLPPEGYFQNTSAGKPIVITITANSSNFAALPAGSPWRLDYAGNAFDGPPPGAPESHAYPWIGLVVVLALVLGRMGWIRRRKNKGNGASLLAATLPLFLAGCQTNLAWVGDKEYVPPAVDRIQVDGFGINDQVDLLPSGNLPITFQRRIVNTGNQAVPAGYEISETVTRLAFQAVGGTAAYVPGDPAQFTVLTCSQPGPAAGGKRAGFLHLSRHGLHARTRGRKPARRRPRLRHVSGNPDPECTGGSPKATRATTWPTTSSSFPARRPVFSVKVTAISTDGCLIRQETLLIRVIHEVGS